MLSKLLINIKSLRDNLFSIFCVYFHLLGQVVL